MDSSFKIPGIYCINHRFQVPLDYATKNMPQISVFARELRAIRHQNSDRPYLVYFQGGPGFPAGRPLSSSGWLKRALEEYHVILLDQRGTGLSSPIDSDQVFAHSRDPQQQADFLSHFRADNIVRDAEFIRQKLLGKKTWSLLGQSYGGFCILSYLSMHPEGVTEAYITGGIPPLQRHVDDVYRATYRRLLSKNQEYFHRYPDDQKLCQKIASFLNHHETFLPNGQRLTCRMFQQLGLQLGMDQGFEEVHYLLEQAFPTVSEDSLSYFFLHQMLLSSSFDTNPIYSLLHEPIYCQNFASLWSAHRIRDEFSEFHFAEGKDFYFTGEMIYPWMFEDYQRLQSLKETAEILAAKDDWPRLYDSEKLNANRVPCAAAVYENDMYVEREFSLETAQHVQALKIWVTSEYEHNGIRMDGYKILDRLIELVKNT